MKRNIRYISIFSLIALVALVGIQVYLITKTHQNEVAQFTKEVKSAFARVQSPFTQIDVLKKDLDQHIEQVYKDYFAQGKNQNKALYGLQRWSESDTYEREIQVAISRELNGVEIGFAAVPTLFVVESTYTETVDTLLFVSEFKPNDLQLFGNLKAGDEKLVIANRSWNMSNDNETNMQYYESFVVSLSDIKAGVLKRMRLLLVFSILTIAVVIGLFFYTIRSLFKQKKIASIKADFVNNITHEFKTPLSTIELATKSLENEQVLLDDTKRSTTLAILKRQNKRLQNMIDEVLHASLNDENIALQKETISICTFLKNCALDFCTKQNMPPERLLLACDTTEDFQLSIDSTKMARAIHNLLDNGYKYDTDHGPQKIAFRNSVDTVFISISDSGRGIAEADKAKVFEKFYRGKNTENKAGLGLGLHYVLDIVQAHGGKVSVQNNAKGELSGACFTLQIPILR